ncbi:MAG: serine/threonine protein kinase [Polyangiaceae bacterium]|nr:serine/threonine protein kinase [Polyangiaceae bacterium]
MAGPLAGGDPSKSATAQARAKALVGRTISDRYRIVELVAMGAMGAVYKGEHLLMRKHVAIKVLHPEIEDFPELVARFEREAIAGAHVNHPNVASASDFGKFDGDSYFLVLEYIEGTTLSDIIKQGPLEPLRAVNIAKQLAAALGAAHLRGIVHRDVKPKNIMICEPSILDTSARGGDDEIVKLIDFGLAKVPVEKLSTVARDPSADGRDLTNAGVVMGTVAYMAPETALGMGAVGPRADFYSLGIILYEMLASMHPFDAVEPQKLFAAHCSLPPPTFAERNKSISVPADLEAIVMRLLQKDPSNRYPDADSLVAAIDAFKMRVALHGTVSLKRPDLPPRAKAENEPTGSSGSGGLYIPKRPSQSRAFQGPYVWIACGIALLAAVAIGFYALGRGTASEQPAKSGHVDSEAPSGAPSTVKTQAPKTSAPPTTAAATTASAENPLLQVLHAKPDPLADASVRSETIKGVSALAENDPKQAAAVFDELSSKQGEAGLEVLYEIVAANETSKAALMARQYFDQPAVLAKASAPLKIAYELRRAACARRSFLFGRAGQEGDARALAVLTSMMPPECQPGASPCCFKQHGDLEKAIADIKARVPAP